MHLQRAGRYREARESYRHPVTGKETSRCVARWPLERSLDEAMGATAAAFEAQLILTIRKGREKDRRRLGKLQRQYVALCNVWFGLPRDGPPPQEDLRRFEIFHNLQKQMMAVAAAGQPAASSGDDLGSR